jgi:hypothetical protein
MDLQAGKEMICVRIRTFNFKNELIDDKTCDFWVDLDEAIEAVLRDLASSKLKRVEIEKVSNQK